MDNEVTVDGQRFGISHVPDATDVFLLTGPNAGRGFTMGGARPHRARIIDACRRFLMALDGPSGRVDYQ